MVKEGWGVEVEVSKKIKRGQDRRRRSREKKTKRGDALTVDVASQIS